MANKDDIDVLFAGGDYVSFLKHAVRVELTNPTPSLLASVFSANVALWRLTDARMTIARMQPGEKNRFAEIYESLHSCNFVDAIAKGSLLASQVATAIKVGVIGKVMRLNQEDAAATATALRISEVEVGNLYAAYLDATQSGWGANSAKELARVAAFIHV